MTPKILLLQKHCICHFEGIFQILGFIKFRIIMEIFNSNIYIYIYGICYETYVLIEEIRKLFFGYALLSGQV